MGNTVLRPAEEVEADQMENDDIEILDELGDFRHSVNTPYSGYNQRIINKGKHPFDSLES